MKVIESGLENCWILEDTVFGDERGYFFESFNRQTFHKLTNLDIDFVQDNQSRSKKGVLRGLHFQKGPNAQAKLVRVIEGKVLDVAVDLRKNSPTFSKSFTIELSEENHLQLFIPRGFAHGFVVLSEWATFFYKCDNYYHKASEGGIIYKDTFLNIDWKINEDEVTVSEKDAILPSFSSASENSGF